VEASPSKQHTVIIRMLPAFLRRRIEHRPGLLKILNNIGWLFFDKILRMGAGLLVGVWIARYLGPEQFGLLNYALAFTGLFGAIATLGLQSIVVRDIVRDPDGTRLTLGTAAVLQFIGGLIAYVLILIGIAYLRPDGMLVRSISAILGAMLLFKASDIAVYWFESQVQSKYVVWVQNSVFLVFAVGKVSLILNKASLTAFVWLMLAEAILAALILIIVFGQFGKPLGTLKANTTRAKTLLKDSWPLLLSSMAIVVYMKIDQIMLGEMVGEESVGIFSAAVKLSEAWYFVPMIIVTSVFPTIIANKKTNEALYIERLQRLYNLLALMSVAVGLVFSLISSWLITTLYGPNYAEAAAVLSIQIWAGIFVSMGIARGKWLLAEDLQHIGYWYIALAMVINIAGNYLLIPLYEEIGAAIATVISQATAAILAPALFKETRVSSIMLLKSLNPVAWVRLFKRPNFII
jgi:O-antigen/teichoic acid export membrane protein